MEEFFVKIIQWNFAAVVGMVTLLIFLKSDLTFDKVVSRYFTLSAFTIVLMAVSDSFAMYLEFPSDSVYTQQLHTFIEAVCYSLRPLVVMFLLLIVVRRRDVVKSLYYIPAIINAVIAFSAMFVPLAYSYANGNTFQRGPLGYTAHIVSLIYAILIINESMRFFKEKNYYEGGVLVWNLMFSIMAVIIDSELQTRLINATSALCMIFYFLFFYTEGSKRDAVTGVRNRDAYFTDCVRFAPQVTALAVFNIGGLNVLNTKDGVAAGDEGVISMTAVIRQHISVTSRLYRVSGDEFVCFFLNESNEIVRTYIDNIKKSMRQSKYLFATGVSFSDRRCGINELYLRAGETMRIDKSNIKAGREYRQRMLAAEAEPALAAE